jgi:hypothetical protein
MPTILAAIVRRQATFLSSPDWLIKPWEGMPKTWADRLIDTMAAIPSILKLYDLLDGQIDSGDFQQQGQKLMESLIELCLTRIRPCRTGIPLLGRTPNHR